MEWQRTAWMVAGIINPWIKRKVTPQQLLKPAQSVDKDADFEELWRRLELQRQRNGGD